MPALKGLVVNVDGAFTSARQRLVSQSGAQCPFLDQVIMRKVQPSSKLAKDLRKAVNDRESVDPKPLSFTRFEISSVDASKRRLTEYKTDNRITVYLDGVQGSKYQGRVRYWQAHVDDLSLSI